jgi:hypothetical protein
MLSSLQIRNRIFLRPVYSDITHMMRDGQADIVHRYERAVGDAFASDLIGGGRRVVETPIAVLLDIDWADRFHHDGQRPTV